MDVSVIGAQKAGTTTFWHHLASHPLVFVPASKEAPFFTFVPPNLGAHEFRGGLVPRLDRAAETELHDWLGEHVWPKLPNAAAERRAFRFWFKTWNVVPDAAPPISPTTRRLLERHYRRDASRRLK